MERIDIALWTTLGGVLSWLILVLILLIFLSSCTRFNIHKPIFKPNVADVDTLPSPCAKVTVIIEKAVSGVTYEVNEVKK